jgi:DNA-3-methyladenine glycosylase II
MVSAGSVCQVSLPLPDIFDFGQCLKFLDRNPNESLHQVENRCLIKLIKLAGEAIIIRISTTTDHLIAESLKGSLSELQKMELSSFVAELFDLNRELNPYYSQMQKDPIMGNLCKQYYGLRLLGIPDLFEALCWCIIGQQINLNFAYRLKKRLVQAVGERLDHRGKDYYAFPAPEVISGMSIKDFSQWQYSTSKAAYIIGVAQQIQAGYISKSKLLNMTASEVKHELMKLRGIGKWSAQYVMMKCLRINTAFPADDVGLQNAIRIVTGSTQKPSLQQLQELDEKWHPWQAYATFYLWHSLIK